MLETVTIFGIVRYHVFWFAKPASNTHIQASNSSPVSETITPYALFFYNGEKLIKFISKSK